MGSLFCAMLEKGPGRTFAALRQSVFAAALSFSALVAEAGNADVFTLDGDLRTTPFRQADFKWMVHPRHDYSKAYVLKLFLCQAEFDREYLGKYKMRDNGRQTVYMTCEQAMEAIKGIDAITLGLPKIVYLVGWQYNGHDSKYPAFFEGNRAVARACDKDPLDSVRWLMREAKKYNTTVSLHINLFDAYEDSPLFKEYVDKDVLAREKDGSLRHSDWAYKVSYAAEWEKGLVKKRIDRLFDLLPVREAGTIHIDAFHNAVPLPTRENNDRYVIRYQSPISPWHGHTRGQDIEAKRKIVKYLDAKGVDVTTEGVGNMDIGGGREGYFPMFWLYNNRNYALSLQASQACGGVCSIKAFGDNANGEAIFRNNPDLTKAFDIFKREFCKTTLICQYLNTFGRQALIEGKDGSIGVFEKGVRTMWKGGRLSVAKDGEMLSDGRDMLIPAVWLGDRAVVAYSENGCRDRRWTLPEGAGLSSNAKAWTVSAKGREPFGGFKIDGNVVTLTLEPGEMVLLKNQ